MTGPAPARSFALVGDSAAAPSGAATVVDPERSWDAFWRERKGNRVTTIRGVVVRIPTGMTLAYQQSIEERLAAGTRALAPLAMDLLRAPDGTAIPDLWDQWRDAGMEIEELEAVVLWATRHAGGDPITFAEAADITDAEIRRRREARAAEAAGEPAPAGKAPARPRASSSAGTGGRSSRASGSTTGSGRKRSRS